MRTADVLTAAAALQRALTAAGHPSVSTLDAVEITETVLAAANPMRDHPASRDCAVCGEPVRGLGRWCSQSCWRADEGHARDDEPCPKCAGLTHLEVGEIRRSQETGGLYA